MANSRACAVLLQGRMAVKKPERRGNGGCGEWEASDKRTVRRLLASVLRCMSSVAGADAVGSGSGTASGALHI